MAKNKIKNKCDTSVNWAKATFIPEKDEIIVYSDLKKIKIGDGETPIYLLPFADSENSVYTGKFNIQSFNKNGGEII